MDIASTYMVRAKWHTQKSKNRAESNAKIQFVFLRPKA